MQTLARTVYLDSEFGVPVELSPAGTALENPFVYDAAAQEIKAMAEKGLVEILSERRATVADQDLIARLSFRRMR